MFHRAARTCATPGCPNLVRGSDRYCPLHEPPVERKPDERPSASRRGYDAAWRRIRKAFLRAHPMCEWPGCDEPATEPDHILPRKAGGTDDWDNLRAFCHVHHSRKTARYDGGYGNSKRVGI